MGITLRKTRRLPVLLAAVGFFVAAYLQYLHVRAWLDPASGGFCSVSQRLDCVAVALSPWSTLLGVPVAGWGLLGFWMLLLAAWRGSRWMVPLSALAALASLALLLLELATIGAVCLFCEAAHVVSWLLFAAVLRHRKDWTGPLKDSTLLSFAALPSAGIVLAIWLFVPAYWRTVTWKGELPLPHGVTAEGHHWVGAANPSLTLEEWIDYACPHCKASSAWTLRQVAAHPTQLRLVRRLNPRMSCRAGSPYSCVFARAALCAADQNRLWQVDRWLFANYQGKAQIDVQKLSRDVGLDGADLERCMRHPQTYAKANDESRVARKNRLLDTPGYRIDGKKVKPAVMEARVEALR